MKLLVAVSFIVALSCLGCSIHQEPYDVDKQYDILIREGVVIDGTGSPGRKTDILIQHGRIVHIGHVEPAKITVREIINASGMVVTPGFIDTHAHGSPVRTPEFRNFTAMGVTTIFLGQDGASAANISEWMHQVEKARPSLNIATLVGHGTVRNSAGIKLNPDPQTDDLLWMAELVDNALEAGCFGLSTGLEYQPGIFSSAVELTAIALPVGRRNRIIHSHMRSEDDDVIDSAIQELIAQGKSGSCAVHISHLKVVYGHGEKRAVEILEQLAEARRSGSHITADMYPYTASHTGIGIVFPIWAKPPNDYKEVAASRRKELAAYLRKRVELRNGPEATLFGTAPWAGKTLKQVADELNKPFEDVLIDDIGPGGASAAYFVMDSELQNHMFVDSHVMVCSDGSPTMRHPRGYGSFAKVIRYYVRERNLLTLEEAVHKMTGLPAATMGLIGQKRGLLKSEFAADVLVFDPEKVQDRATFEKPHQLTEGFDWVLVNGIPVRAQGEFTGDRGGNMLRKHDE
ncbi:amidohydrolase family protein [Candidatus Omnitrophota bacterium]